MTVNLVIIVGATEPLFDLNHLYFPTDASLKLIIFLVFFEVKFSQARTGHTDTSSTKRTWCKPLKKQKKKKKLAPFFPFNFLIA